MKYLILLSFAFAPNAFAADNCASVWIYKAFKTCADPANGLDLNAPGELQTGLNLWSQWLRGGRNQLEVCQGVRDTFNKTNSRNGLHAEIASPRPLGEETERDDLFQQNYRYQCEIKVKKYPFKVAAGPACGAEDKISYQVGGSSRGLSGEGLTCLSCENVADQKPTAMVDCLRENIINIIEPKAIDLRETDLQAVSRQASRMLSLSQQVTIQNLQTTEELSFFSNFITNHPFPKSQNDSPRGGGGLGTLPTLQ